MVPSVVCKLHQCHALLPEKCLLFCCSFGVRLRVFRELTNMMTHFEFTRFTSHKRTKTHSTFPSQPTNDTMQITAVSVSVFVIASVFVSLVLVHKGGDENQLRFQKIYLNIRSASSNQSIPKVVHQSWKTSDVPEFYQQWQASWLALQPEWQYRLWTDEDNDKLVETHFQWFLPTYQSLPVKIMQVDAVRYMYLYMHGGVYADLDVEVLRPLDELLEGKNVVLGVLSNDTDFEHNIPNAFMASVPQHDFWMLCLNLITWQLASGKAGAEVITGPIMLKEAVWHYEQIKKEGESDLSILPPKTVYNDWRRKPPSCRFNTETFNATRCRDHYKNNYVMSYWTHNWEQQVVGPQDGN